MEYKKIPVIYDEELQSFSMGAECGGLGNFYLHEGVIVFSCLSIPAGIANSMFPQYKKIHNLREGEPDWNAAAELLIECRWDTKFDDFLETLDKDSEEYKELKSAMEKCISERISEHEKEIRKWKSLSEKL